MFDIAGKRIYVAGHAGLVGSALCRRLAREDCTVLTRPKAQLDLRNQQATYAWLQQEKPDAVIMAAAHVGGIAANMAEPAVFLHDNMLMAAHVIHGSYLAGVKKLLYLGSSCMYPRGADLPLQEGAVLTGAFEPTNAPYALAKCAGVELCRTYRAQYGCDFISAIPCNLYGANDCYDTFRSHVIPALLMKFHKAKVEGRTSVELWGSGRPRREFLCSDDAADALVFVLQHYSEAAPVNVGSGAEISIADLAALIADVVGYTGAMTFDTGQPDGVLSKVMDVSRLQAMGWQPRFDLRSGLAVAYQDYVGMLVDAA